MIRNYPWLYSRKYHIFQIFFETLIFFYLKFVYSDILINSLLFLLLYFSWVLTSYVLGRYNLYEKNIVYSFLKVSLKSFILLTGFCILISIISYFSKNINIYFSFQNTLKFLYYVFIYNFSFQFLYQMFSIFFKKNSEIWVFIGREEKYNECIEILKEQSLENLSKNDIKLIYQDSLNQIPKNNIKGILIENKNIKKNDLRLKAFKRKGIHVYSIIDWSELILQRYPYVLLDLKRKDFSIFEVNPNEFKLKIKSFFETIISIFLILITTPFILIASILIFIEDKGPIFYSQKRTGLNGKIFKINKLRTMIINSENGIAKWSFKNDKRITKIGSILRRLRIDELPQLISVINGDMSLIGPRPERPEIIKDLEKIIPFYNERHKIKPGISGWAQVNYPYGASVDDAKVKLSYDLYYLKNYSILLDILILFKTIRLVFNAKGAISKKIQ